VNEPPGTSPRLRVLIALQYYRPHRTGLTLHAQHLAEELARRGHVVTVITARLDPSTPAAATERGVRVHRLWAPLRISRGMLMPGYPYRVWRLLDGCDVVSVHTPLLETALIGFLCRLRGVRMVITHHGDLVLPPGPVDRLVEGLVRRLHRFGARFAASTVAYSDDYLAHSSWIDRRRPTRVIAPPVEIPTPDDARADRWRRELLAGGDGPLVLFAGRFVREKRPDVAIRAVARLRDRFPHAVLVFAGEHRIAYEGTWAEHAELVDRGRRWLHFTGLITDPDELAALYRAADVVLLTSDTECFGLVQVEAMLCGTPVVMTDIPGGRVPVSRTGMGELAPAGDDEALAHALETVLSNPDGYRISPPEVRARLALDRTIDHYLEVLGASV
jgi:glycosyltransferase involved in cell wall biosynthesis